jgi:hypothetical protein
MNGPLVYVCVVIYAVVQKLCFLVYVCVVIYAVVQKLCFLHPPATRL